MDSFLLINRAYRVPVEDADEVGSFFESRKSKMNYVSSWQSHDPKGAVFFFFFQLKTPFHNITTTTTTHHDHLYHTIIMAALIPNKLSADSIIRLEGQKIEFVI